MKHNAMTGERTWKCVRSDAMLFEAILFLDRNLKKTALQVACQQCCGLQRSLQGHVNIVFPEFVVGTMLVPSCQQGWKTHEMHSALRTSSLLKFSPTFCTIS